VSGNWGPWFARTRRRHRQRAAPHLAGSVPPLRPTALASKPAPNHHPFSLICIFRNRNGPELAFLCRGVRHRSFSPCPSAIAPAGHGGAGPRPWRFREIIVVRGISRKLGPVYGAAPARAPFGDEAPTRALVDSPLAAPGTDRSRPSGRAGGPGPQPVPGLVPEIFRRGLTEFSSAWPAAIAATSLAARPAMRGAAARAAAFGGTGPPPKTRVLSKCQATKSARPADADASGPIEGHAGESSHPTCGRRTKSQLVNRPSPKQPPLNEARLNTMPSISLLPDRSGPGVSGDFCRVGLAALHRPELGRSGSFPLRRRAAGLRLIVGVSAAGRSRCFIRPKQCGKGGSPHLLENGGLSKLHRSPGVK